MTQEGSSPIPPETQQQRWIKYGANVVFASVIVILLAVLAVYLAERKSHRFDTTSTGLYSLKPQTLNLIKDNKQKITIISLYEKPKAGGVDVDTTADESSAAPAVDQPGVVADLLEEYRTRGANIETQVIDPVQSPTKVDDLIKNVEEQYGGEIKKYKTFTETVPAKYDSISKLANAELENIKHLPLNEIQSDDVEQSVGLALFSVQEIPKIMKQGQDDFARFLKKKPPDYKGITDNVGQTMQGLSDIVGKVIDGFGKSKEDKAVPPAIRAYMTDSQSKYVEIKKQADDLIKEEKGLGELKLDTLREALRQKNPILVRGEKEWRVIPYEKVWKDDTHQVRSDAPVQPQFFGEKMITTAILSLNQTAKPKVCFVRAGGPPITEFGGRLNSVADRLRDYNFDVSEKDLSGTYAMQAMQQQQQPTPEPSDDEIADAVWVVDGAPAQSNPMMGGPPPSNSGKIADHLEKGFHYVDGKKLPGGAAFMLFLPHGDDLSAAIKPWGITARTDALAVHKLVKAEGAAQSDIINSASRTPFIFTIKDWGDHAITRPLASLEGILLQAAPIQVVHVDGVTNTPLVPVPGAPNSPDSWGETDFQSIETGPKFDRDADIAPPLYVGAAAEKSGQRVVCMGSEPSFIGSTGDLTNNIVDFPVQDIMEKRGILVPQFPGDSEFFMNSIFWLSHQEQMIALSPAAMNISRISDMSNGTLKLWHIGVLLIGLPGLVLIAGIGAYLSRRD